MWEMVRARATFEKRSFTKTPPTSCAVLVRGQCRLALARRYLSFDTQRGETLAPFDGQPDRTRRSRLWHGHFHTQFLSGPTHRRIHGMLRQKESHRLYERRYWFSPVDDPSVYMKVGWMIGRICHQMAVSYVQRDVVHFPRGIPGASVQVFR